MRTFIAFFNHPERVFVLLALLAGCGLVFWVPPGAGYDENAHLIRVIEVSAKELIPNRLLNERLLIPAVFDKISYRNQNFYRTLDASFFQTYLNMAVDWNDVVPKTTYSVYFPSLYFPPALVIWVGRRLHFSVLAIYYLCRLIECLGYILLAGLAIRIAPFGKWVLVVLALSPTALLQSSAISTDPYTNGAAFLFVAWTLALALQERPISNRQAALSLLIVFLLFSSKVNASVLALLFLAIPRRKFASQTAYWLLLAGGGLLFLSMVIGWNAYISLSFRTERSDRGIWRQAAGILADPVGFARLFFGDILQYGRSYVTQWIATTPNEIGEVPVFVYPLYLILLLLAVLSDATARIPRSVRLLLLAAFIASYSASAVFLYLGGRGPGEEINMPGRYLVLTTPALFLALAPGRRLPGFAWLKPALPAFALGVSILPAFVAAIYLTFFVPCGGSYYVPGLCYLPRYKNLDPQKHLSPPLTRGTRVTQEFHAECDTIQSIQVWAHPAAQTSDQSTRLVIRDAGSGENLASASLPNRAVDGQDWIDIPFSPLSAVNGRQLIIELSSENPDPQTALTVALSAYREYRDGSLTIDGAPVTQDLYFHYGCLVH